MFDLYIRKKEDLIEAVRTFGFVPFFKNAIEGFSIEEHCAPEAWFPREGEGVWEWKGPVIRESGCAYGKFFGGKAVFVSREAFFDFADARRDGYDFDARTDDGLTSFRERFLYGLVADNAPILSTRLKDLGGYGKEGKGGFETLVNRLQHLCYLLIGDFVYPTGKDGRPYGWGLAQYTTPEERYGDEFRRAVYRKTPREAYEATLERLARLLPAAPAPRLAALLGQKPAR